MEGQYEAEYPVFIVGDSPESLTFTVTVDERRFASLGNVPDDPIETDIRRRYVTRTSPLAKNGPLLLSTDDPP